MEAQKKELSENGTLKIYNPLTKAELHVSNSIWNIAHQVFYLLFNYLFAFSDFIDRIFDKIQNFQRECIMRSIFCKTKSIQYLNHFKRIIEMSL